jgi:ceramide glucosyltransferase
MVLESILLGLALVSLVVIWRSYRWQRRAIRQRDYPEGLADYPSLSVIRPIRGLDTGAAENIDAALDNGYPGDVETFFVFDDDQEPAIPLVERAIEARRAAGKPVNAQILLAGNPPGNRTGKLNAMIVGMREASNELVAFVDSDVRQDRQAFKVLVDTLMRTPKAGAAFAPVVVTERPETVGDVGYALMLNGMYGPAAAATADERAGDLPFIMGQFMAFKREAISAIGGLETAQGQLVDDMYLGQRLVECGYRNAMSPHPVAIVQKGSTLNQFAGTFIRWITFSRSGLPAMSFKINSWLLAIAFWLGLAAAALAASQGLVAATAFSLLAPLAVSGLVNRLHRLLGGGALSFAHQWVAFALYLTAPIVYGAIFSKQEVNWRGRRYQLNAHSRLA